MIDSRSINMSVTSGLRALRAVPRRRRAAFAAAAVLLAVGMVAAVRDGGSNLLLQRVIDGLSNGFVYSAMAVALVLIYKATTIVNFAQGEMAMFGVFICYAFWNSLGIPMAVAILLGMAVSAAAAACIERVLIRPFDPSNHLAITIVTLGLFLVLNAVAGVLWGFEPRLPLTVPTCQSAAEHLRRAGRVDEPVHLGHDPRRGVGHLAVAGEGEDRPGVPRRVDQRGVEPAPRHPHRTDAPVRVGARCGDGHAGRRADRPHHLPRPQLHGSGAGLFVRGRNARRPRQRLRCTARWGRAGAPRRWPVDTSASSGRSWHRQWRCW